MAHDVVSPAPTEEPRLEASRRRTVGFVAVGLLIVIALGMVAVKAIGGSVLYYKTPSELIAQHPAGQVRLAGKLVKGSTITHADGAITFDIADASTVVHVRYVGGATTALQSAGRPGAQMVAEGTIDASNVFQANNLLAKCPSKFASAAPSKHASLAANS